MSKKVIADDDYERTRQLALEAAKRTFSLLEDLNKLA